MKDILQKLATQKNLPISKVEEAVMFQFKYVGQTIKSGKFETIRLPYFGKFHVRPGRLKYLNERSNKI